MFNFADLTEGNETLKVLMEEGEGEETSVSIEQKIEVETEVAEEVEVAEEAEESVEEVEEVTEASEAFIAMFDRAEMVMDVIREHGYTKPIAMILNHGQTSEIGGDLERGFGVTLPANESLDVVGSKYDTNVATLEGGFKKTMQNFWAWIKKIAKKIWEMIKSLVSRIRAFFSSVRGTISRLSKALKDRNWDEDKAKDKKFKLAAKGRVFPMFTIVAEVKKVITAVEEKAKGVLTGADSGNLTQETVNGLNALVADQVKASFTSGPLKEFIDDLKTGKRSKIWAVDEVTAKGGTIGDWTLADAKDDTKIFAFLASVDTLMAVSKGVEDLTKRLDKIAGKYAGKSSDDEANKQLAVIKKGTSAAVKALNMVVRICKQLSRYALFSGKEFVKVQRAFIACTK